MEKSPNLEPFISPNVPSSSILSVQPSIPDHTQPSPLVSADSPPKRPPASYPYSVGTNMVITQIPSARPSADIYSERPKDIKCSHCHLQVTTHVTRVLMTECDYWYTRFDSFNQAVLWLFLLVCFPILLARLILFICFPSYRHTCPNCRRLCGYGIRRE